MEKTYMKKISKHSGITLVALVVTIIILLILAGITINSLTDSGLFGKVKEAKEKYSISEAKEKLEMAIMELRLDKEGKGEHLKREDLSLMNNDEIDVRDTTNFPVEAICGKYKFNIDENYVVTYVGEASGTIIRCSIDPEGYTNKDVVKILLKISNSKGIKTIENPDNDIATYNGEKQIELNYEVTKNGRYMFKIIDSENKETDKEVVIDKIDKLAPLDFNITVEKKGRTITINGSTADAEATQDKTSIKSGIDYYKYYLINQNNETKEYDTNKIENLEFGTYQIYVVAYDKAGNSKKSNTENADIIVFKEVAGGYEHSLAIDSEGNLWAWGDNEYGQLGDGTTTNRTSPAQITSGIKFSQIATRYNYSLAIDSAGNLWAWGQNNQGQLGDETTINKTSPVQIKSGTKFNKISAGNGHSLAIDSEGNLWAWGCNNYGQLGDETTINKTSPVQIKSGTKFDQISSGVAHSLAIDNEGNLWTWGLNNYGQLGDGTTTEKTSPIQIKSETKFSQISAGSMHNLAIDGKGNLWAWGSNECSQLGDGTTTDKTSPVPIKSETKFNQISTGSLHSFAADNKGNLWIWGYNLKGELGDGTTTSKASPVQIIGIEFTQISLGYFHSLTIDNEGNLFAWGWNNCGQLGDGTTTDRTSPVPIKPQFLNN